MKHFEGKKQIIFRYNTERADTEFFTKELPHLLKTLNPWRITYKNEYDLCPGCLRHFKQPKYQFCFDCKDKIG